jgi:hypothetical protein
MQHAHAARSSMNPFQAIFSILAFSVLGTAWAGPIPETQDSAMGFSSFDLPAEQTGSFEVSFDATPLADKIDVFTGFSAMAAGSATDVAAIVRFNDKGTIDVRNGSAFQADQVLAYSANKTYRMRMVIDVANKKYSVFVTLAGQPELALAKNYAFRSQQATVRSLNKMVLAGFKGSDGQFKGAHRIAGVSVKAAAAP